MIPIDAKVAYKAIKHSFDNDKKDLSLKDIYKLETVLKQVKMAAPVNRNDVYSTYRYMSMSPEERAKIQEDNFNRHLPRTIIGGRKSKAVKSKAVKSKAVKSKATKSKAVKSKAVKSKATKSKSVKSKK